MFHCFSPFTNLEPKFLREPSDDVKDCKGAYTDLLSVVSSIDKSATTFLPRFSWTSWTFWILLFLEDQLSTSKVFVASIATLNFKIQDALPICFDAPQGHRCQHNIFGWGCWTWSPTRWHSSLHWKNMVLLKKVMLPLNSSEKNRR